MIIAVTARYGMDIQQLDVTTAYLNGTIDEQVYMSPPKMLDKSLETIIESETNNSKLGIKVRQMLEELKTTNIVCLLKKFLYGLRQAGKCWYSKLDQTLRKHGATPCHADPCVYHIGQGDNLLLITIYVDDILLASRDHEAINDMKKKLSQEFEIRDLEKVSCCLGIQFTRNSNKIIMHQKGYIEDILRRFGMTESKPVGTPMDSNVKLS